MCTSLTGLGEVFESFVSLLILLLNGIPGEKKIMRIFLSRVFMTDLTVFSTALNSVFKGMWLSFRELFQLFLDFE